MDTLQSKYPGEDSRRDGHEQHSLTYCNATCALRTRALEDRLEKVERMLEHTMLAQDRALQQQENTTPHRISGQESFGLPHKRRLTEADGSRYLRGELRMWEQPVDHFYERYQLTHGRYQTRVRDDKERAEFLDRRMDQVERQVEGLFHQLRGLTRGLPDLKGRASRQEEKQASFENDITGRTSELEQVVKRLLLKPQCPDAVRRVPAEVIQEIVEYWETERGEDTHVLEDQLDSPFLPSTTTDMQAPTIQFGDEVEGEAANNDNELLVSEQYVGDRAHPAEADRQSSSWKSPLYVPTREESIVEGTYRDETFDSFHQEARPCPRSLKRCAIAGYFFLSAEDLATLSSLDEGSTSVEDQKAESDHHEQPPANVEDYSADVSSSANHSNSQSAANENPRSHTDAAIQTKGFTAEHTTDTSQHFMLLEVPDFSSLLADLYDFLEPFEV